MPYCSICLHITHVKSPTEEISSALGYRSQEKPFDQHMKIEKALPTFLVCLLSSLTVSLLMLIIFFWLSNHHNILPFSGQDFIVLDKSSLVALFFMFISFMVVSISLRTPKPLEGDHHHFDWFFSVPPLILCEMCSTSIEDGDYCYASNSDAEEYHGYDGYDEENDDDDGETEDTDSEDDSKDADHDLERRIEEFIAKMNQKWSEELLADRLLCITAA